MDLRNPEDSEQSLAVHMLPLAESAELIYPSEAPKNIKELLDSMEPNRVALCQLLLQVIAVVLPTITMEQIRNKATRGDQEHGGWTLFGKDDPFAEIKAEGVDSLVYLWWCCCQLHFA